MATVLAANDGLLSTAEVLSVLAEAHEERSALQKTLTADPATAGAWREMGEARWVAKTLTAQYAAVTTGSEEGTAVVTPQHAAMAVEQTGQFFDALRERMEAGELSHLVDAEMMSLANLRPQNAVAVHTIVEDCENRLNDDQVQLLLDTVAECFVPCTDELEEEYEEEEYEEEEENEGEGEAEEDEAEEEEEEEEEQEEDDGDPEAEAEEGEDDTGS